jgi:hypothetical protein
MPFFRPPLQDPAPVVNSRFKRPADEDFDFESKRFRDDSFGKGQAGNRGSYPDYPDIGNSGKSY